jgi:hypothetical protein
MSKYEEMWKSFQIDTKYKAMGLTNHRETNNCKPNIRESISSPYVSKIQSKRHMCASENLSRKASNENQLHFSNEKDFL